MSAPTASISYEHLGLIQQAQRDGTFIYISGDSLDIRFQTQVVKVDINRLVLKNSVSPQYLKKFLLSKNFYLQITLVNFKSSSISSDGKNILIELEDANVIKKTRQIVRHEFKPHEKACCTFINPYDDMTPIRKSVMDLSNYGFSLVTFVKTKLFTLGLEIKNIDFFLKNKKIKSSVSAKVRYVRILVDMSGKHHVQVGFAFLDPAD